MAGWLAWPKGDPAADVDGLDATAKVMILAALVFGRQLGRRQVTGRGITDITNGRSTGRHWPGDG
jgi:homoserine dehydrogenase